jgi:hypothetical protein
MSSENGSLAAADCSVRTRLAASLRNDVGGPSRTTSSPFIFSHANSYRDRTVDDVLIHVPEEQPPVVGILLPSGICITQRPCVCPRDRLYEHSLGRAALFKHLKAIPLARSGLSEHEPGRDPSEVRHIGYRLEVQVCSDPILDLAAVMGLRVLRRTVSGVARSFLEDWIFVVYVLVWAVAILAIAYGAKLALWLLRRRSDRQKHDNERSPR